MTSSLLHQPLPSPSGTSSMMAVGLWRAFGWLFSQDYLLEVVGATLLVLLLPYVVRAAWQQWRIYRAFRTVPCDPDMHFFFGHAPRMVKDMGAMLDWFLDLTRTHGWKAFKFSFGPGMNQLVCTHPDTIKTVLKADPKSDVVYYAFLPWLGDGVLLANGPKWSRARRLLTPAFHFDILRPYTSVYAEAADAMTDLWSKVPEGEPVDVFPYISLFTLDVMLRCTCSFESNCQIEKTHSPYISAVYELTDLAVKRILWFPAYYNWIYMLTREGWQFRRACSTVHKFSEDVIRKRRAALEEKKRKGEDVLKGSRKKYLDFIDILLEAKDEKGVGLTDLEIRNEVDTFMFEGHDTTASGIVWALYNLAKHPEHQEKCREEVDAIFDQKGAIEWEDLKSLVYLKNCIKESLRLFPPVPGVGRTLAQPTEIDGHQMAKGTPVAAMMYAVHRHPDVWENPDEFNPLRFLPENSRNRSPHAFVAFSAGPRNCIGQEFALNEEKVAVAHVLRKFHLSLDETRLPEKDYLVILRPKPGLFLKLKHRNI